MTIDQLKAIASDPCINLSGLLLDAKVSRSTFDQYVTGKRGKYGIKKDVAERLEAAMERLIGRLRQPEICEECDWLELPDDTAVCKVCGFTVPF